MRLRVHYLNNLFGRFGIGENACEREEISQERLTIFAAGPALLAELALN